MAYGYMDAAQAQFGLQPQYYPGNPVAGFNGMQTGGWGSLQSGAQMGQDFASNMGDQFMGMLENPYNVDPSQMPQVGYNNIQGMPQVGAQQIGQGPQVQGSNVQGSNVWGQQIGAGPQVQNQNTKAMMIGQGPQVSGQQMAGQGQQVNAQNVGGIPQVGLGGMDYFNNPYLKSSIQSGIDQNNTNFDENVMTSLDADAIGAGMSG